MISINWQFKPWLFLLSFLASFVLFAYLGQAGQPIILNMWLFGSLAIVGCLLALNTKEVPLSFFEKTKWFCGACLAFAVLTIGFMEGLVSFNSSDPITSDYFQATMPVWRKHLIPSAIFLASGLAIAHGKIRRIQNRSHNV